MESLKDELPFVLLDELPISIAFYKPLRVSSANSSLHHFQLAYHNKTAKLEEARIEVAGGKLIRMPPDIVDENYYELLTQLNHVIQTGETMDEEVYVPGTRKYFQITRNKVKQGVLTTARDVTEAVMTRKEKQKQSELSSRILNTALNGWFYCEAIRDEQGDISDFEFVTINPAFTEMIKMDEREVLGRTHLSLFPTSKTNGVHDLNCRVVNNKKPERKQMHYKGDNIDAWYDVVASPLGENGLLVTFADITHTKQKEIEAANLADTLTTVINTAQVGIFTIKPEYGKTNKIVDFRFTMVNPALSAYVAQEPETLLGALASEWFPGYLNNGVFHMYRDTFVSGQTHRRQFHYNVDGIDVYLDVQSTRISGEVLVTFSDFTPLQLAQLELQKSIRELERSNRNLEEFTRAASHDLKEPIRKIQLFSERLRNMIGNDLNDSARDMFERMENAATRMRLLIDDLLEYSYVNSAASENEVVDINELVSHVTAELEFMIEETGAVIDFEHLPVLTGNRRQLHQLFLNLVNNAIKYRKPGINPHIFIHSKSIPGEDTQFALPDAERPRRFTAIEVADNGIGFDQSDAEKIFQVFTRLQHSREYVGTGIGLAIANKVMENHSGYIFARAVKGQGATFTLLFPEEL